MYHAIPATAPFALLPSCLLILCIHRWSASARAFIRDIGQAVGVLITALMPLSPIFLLTPSLPLRFQHLAYRKATRLFIKQSYNVLALVKTLHLARQGLPYERLLSDRAVWFRVVPKNA
jgi:lipopolysaccharide transport system permease protein